MCNNGEGFVNLARVDMSLSLKVLGHICSSCYRTYVMILYNWLIL